MSPAFERITAGPVPLLRHRSALVYNRRHQGGSMPTRKQRTAKRKAAPARTRPKKTASRKSAAPARERRQQAPETLRLRSLEPSLTVDDLERSLRFYTDVLGFFAGDRWED